MKHKAYLEIILIIIIYFLMITGGVWHMLGRFQNEMRLLASPLLIILSLIVFLEYWYKSTKVHVILWGVLLLCLGIAIEWVGVKTGLLFGHYCYGNTLQPQIDGIPVPIGFAWVNMEISSLILAQRVTRHKQWLPVFTALFMVIFDFFMEVPAGQLGYWTWMDNIPLQNFVAWFIFGYLLLILGQYLNAVERIKSKLIVHIYFAQLLFFILVMLKS